MKETYYKLNREKEYFNSTLELLVNNGVLEEVQDTKEDLPYTEEIANRKLQEESKQAIDNMFGNPLEQVEKLTSIKTAEYDMPRSEERIIKKVTKFNPKTMAQCACGCTQEYPHSHLVAGKKCECEEGRDTKVNAGGIDFLDLLVEELKKNNLIK